jgi:hypothetical protein
MAAHKTNPLLKWSAIPGVVILGMLIYYLSTHHPSTSPVKKSLMPSSHTVVNTASQDSAAESLDTLTVQWSSTEQRVKAIVEDNKKLQQDNKTLLQQLQEKTDKNTTSLTTTVTQLQSQITALTTHSAPENSSTEPAQPIQAVPELAESLHANFSSSKLEKNTSGNDQSHKVLTPKPVYTIPANATAVQNRLMTALVGRIPVKGVVVDPYPFKIVFSDDTLAANGLRVPNLCQMIVSGYTEGDLNLVSVRGWVTSLTFVFNDGTISTTTSNDNNIGRYTKENALGYLSDATGNPFIRGKLITNAPAFVGINVALGAAQGAANAFAQSQTTSNIGSAGNTTASVTGSMGAFVAGQSANNAMGQVQQWWRDREEQSFDAVYVPTVDPKNNRSQTVVVNFAKEIRIDYDTQGRKIVYEQKNNSVRTTDLD